VIDAANARVPTTVKLSSGAPYGFHDDCVIALALAAWSLKRGDRTPEVGGAPEVFCGDDWDSHPRGHGGLYGLP
jgi:hypothetical protein